MHRLRQIIRLFFVSVVFQSVLYSFCFGAPEVTADSEVCSPTQGPRDSPVVEKPHRCPTREEVISVLGEQFSAQEAPKDFRSATELVRLILKVNRLSFLRLELVYRIHEIESGRFEWVLLGSKDIQEAVSWLNVMWVMANVGRYGMWTVEDEIQRMERLIEVDESPPNVLREISSWFPSLSKSDGRWKRISSEPENLVYDTLGQPIAAAYVIWDTTPESDYFTSLFWEVVRDVHHPETPQYSINIQDHLSDAFAQYVQNLWLNSKQEVGNTCKVTKKRLCEQTLWLNRRVVNEFNQRAGKCRIRRVYLQKDTSRQHSRPVSAWKAIDQSAVVLPR